MPSGWEKSEDYGGRDPSPLGWIAIAAVFLLMSVGLITCQEAIKPANAQPATQIIGRASVIDGDTIEIRGQRIRLWGIDAPESAQTCTGDNGAIEPAGRRSANALAEFIGEANVTCTERDRDRYGRAVSVCTVQAVDVSREMVAQGWSRAFVRYSRDYVAEEQSAREAERGAWAWNCVAPWDYRAARRRN